jgi:hypothetical protein
MGLARWTFPVPVHVVVTSEGWGIGHRHQGFANGQEDLRCVRRIRGPVSCLYTLASTLRSPARPARRVWLSPRGESAGTVEVGSAPGRGMGPTRINVCAACAGLARQNRNINSLRGEGYQIRPRSLEFGGEWVDLRGNEAISSLRSTSSPRTPSRRGPQSWTRHPEKGPLAHLRRTHTRHHRNQSFKQLESRRGWAGMASFPVAWAPTGEARGSSTLSLDGLRAELRAGSKALEERGLNVGKRL